MATAANSQRGAPRQATLAPLAELVMLGDVPGVVRALHAGASPNDCTEFNEPGWSVRRCSPLYRAAKHGHEQILGVLLQARADVAYVDAQGFSALHIAVQRGHGSAAQRLIAGGADLDAPSHGFRSTPLHWAANHGKTACVNLLLRAYADPSARNRKRQTALQVAEEKRHVSAAAALRDPPVDAARACGLLDRALLRGTRLAIDKLGEGTYEAFERNSVGANTHHITFKRGTQQVKLRGLKPEQWSVVPLPDSRMICRARQLLAFACGTIEFSIAHHCDIGCDVLNEIGMLLAAAEMPPRTLADRDSWDRLSLAAGGRTRARSTVSRDSSRALLQSGVKVQWSGTGQFHDAHLELRHTRLTFRDRRGGKELAVAPVPGVDVGYPKTARKGHPFSLRLDVGTPGQLGFSKYICSFESLERCTEWADAIKTAHSPMGHNAERTGAGSEVDFEPNGRLAEGVPPDGSRLKLVRLASEEERRTRQQIDALVANIAEEDVRVDMELAEVQATVAALTNLKD
eukprot:COSAG02_NODE_6552_length_3500_cov_56.166422_2_plen_516_part_00